MGSGSGYAVARRKLLDGGNILTIIYPSTWQYDTNVSYICRFINAGNDNNQTFREMFYVEGNGPLGSKSFEDFLTGWHLSKTLMGWVKVGSERIIEVAGSQGVWQEWTFRNDTKQDITAFQVLFCACGRKFEAHFRCLASGKEQWQPVFEYLLNGLAISKVSTLVQTPSAPAPALPVPKPPQMTETHDWDKETQDYQSKNRPVIQHGAIEGGAWIVKSGGQSDLLRGLTVYILKPVVDTELITSELKQLREECAKTVKMQNELADDYSNDSDLQEYVPVARAGAKAAKIDGEVTDSMLSKSSTVKINQLHKLKHQLYKINYATNTKAIQLLGIQNFSFLWESIVGKFLASKGVSGIDGNYSIPNVTSGEYILYACASSEAYYVEWFFPVSIVGGQTTKVDLFNDNATFILNAK